MIYGFEYSTDARDSHVVVKKFQSEAAAKRWRDEKREAFAYPGAATHSVPAYQQNWHHKIRQLYRFEGRIPAEAMHWIRARVQDSFGSMYSETVNQGVMNYVAVHGEEIK